MEREIRGRGDMGNSLCASSRKDANGFSWFRKAPDANARPMFRESAIVRKAREEREAREGGMRATRTNPALRIPDFSGIAVREQREQALETAIEGGVKGIASELLRTTDSEVGPCAHLFAAVVRGLTRGPPLCSGRGQAADCADQGGHGLSRLGQGVRRRAAAWWRPRTRIPFTRQGRHFSFLLLP